MIHHAQFLHFQFAQDVKQILPTFVILVVTFILMFTLIPYAFSEVIKWVFLYC